MRLVVAVTAGVAIFLASGLAAPAGAAHASMHHPQGRTVVATAHGLARPLVAIIEADWCPTCQMMKPTLAKLRRDLGDRVAFLTLDVTDDAHEAASEKLARKYGILAFYSKYQSQTSTVGIFAPRSVAPADVLVGQGEEAPYLTALAPWLSKRR